MTYPEIKASQFPFLFPIDSLFFLPLSRFFSSQVSHSLPGQSVTHLSFYSCFLSTYPLLLLFDGKHHIFLSNPILCLLFEEKSHSPQALSAAHANCEQGSLHLLNIIRNIQFLNYAWILSEYYQIIIRILSAAPAHFEHEYLHLLNIIHTIQFRNYSRVFSGNKTWVYQNPDKKSAHCVTRAPPLLQISRDALSFKVCQWVRDRWHLTRSLLF